MPVGHSDRDLETILLVADEALVRRYARDQLRSLGYVVLEAETGHTALSDEWRTASPAWHPPAFSRRIGPREGSGL